MPLAIVYSRARLGIEAPLVTVEVHLSGGLPAFHIVGLPEASVRESKDRVRSAIINSGFKFPDNKIIVNLAPADLPKEGGRFDLPIAIGILAANGDINPEVLADYEFYGELALTGEIRAIIGEVPVVQAAKMASRNCLLPSNNVEHATLVKDAVILSATHLLTVFHHLTGQLALALEQAPVKHLDMPFELDLSDVIGQPMAKRALEIAACGGHNLLFMGPAGTGKSMLAQRMPSIMPPMTDEEAIETLAIHSISNANIDLASWRQRPYRAPHHTVSGVALVGGGSHPKPGEISLAHNGILFLDELPEFERRVLDVLREPLETGKVLISRAARQAEFPANFQLIAAMNPSPTGDNEDGRATSEQVLRYLNRISGPFLDRIDLQVEVPRLPKGALTEQNVERGESSEFVRQRVMAARAVQIERAGKSNAALTGREIDKHCQLSFDDAQFLEQAMDKLQLSTRAFHKILKVARTIADLQGVKMIDRSHLAEALGYRAMDRLLLRLKA